MGCMQHMNLASQKKKNPPKQNLNFKNKIILLSQNLIDMLWPQSKS